MKKPAGKKRNARPSKTAEPGSKAGTAVSASGRASAAAKPDGKPPKPLEPAVLEPTELVPTLTASEQEELDRCEKTISKGWNSFIEVGEALLKIRDAKLYRDSHERFEDYCREKLQYQKSQAYRLMDAARVVRLISPIGEVSADGVMHPTCEAQVRPLVGLKDHDIKTVWQKAAATAQAEERPITARLVQTQVRAITPRDTSNTRRPDTTPNNKDIAWKLFQRILKLIDEGEKRAEADHLKNQILNLIPRIKRRIFA